MLSLFCFIMEKEDCGGQVSCPKPTKRRGGELGFKLKSVCES